jgi:CBS domain-containing membrane protein
MPNRRWQKALMLVGLELSPVSHVERLVSTLGGFLGIYAIVIISARFVDLQATALIVASMGASAVLLFAVPHGPLSQPWPVFGGHLISALVGVSCAKLIPTHAIAAAAAVSLAIGAMHYLRCIHPPGGATALTAVVGGPTVQALGYDYVVTPVLLNVVVILTVAIVFNAPFAWRRYPPPLRRAKRMEEGETTGPISHENLVYALSEIDSFIDVSEQDLLAIYDLATQRSEEVNLKPEQIELGHYYSNGKYAGEWSVRQVIDAAEKSGDPSRDTVIFKVAAGEGRYSTGVSTRADFARWARYEVYREDDNWRRMDDALRRAGPGGT